MVDGLLNEWVGDLMDDSLNCMGRQLNMVMKLGIAVVEKRTELNEKISNIEFCIYGH
jgi:hypothetical protein